jgi:hypothetical protein
MFGERKMSGAQYHKVTTYVVFREVFHGLFLLFFGLPWLWVPSSLLVRTDRREGDRTEWEIEGRMGLSTL